MKILVTGAAGFIGTHLTKKLIDRGDEVIGLDNFNSYYSPNIKRQNVELLLDRPAFTLVEEDITNRENILELFESEKFDGVVHLAAMAGVRNAVKFPDYYVNVNYNGTQNLLDASRNIGVQNFVFASTSSVYGDTQQIPFVETDTCDRPLQPYAAAKRAAEMLGFTYNHLFGLNFTSTRFFTVYGPHNRPDMMAHLVLDSLTKGVEIPLYENGNMWRDWTYVGDITDGLILALDQPLGYEIFNLGNGNPVSLKYFIEQMAQLAGSKGNFVPQPKLNADVLKTFANINKAKQLLGYAPKVSIEEGARLLWEWYQTLNCNI